MALAVVGLLLVWVSLCIVTFVAYRMYMRHRDRKHEERIKQLETQQTLFENDELFDDEDL